MNCSSYSVIVDVSLNVSMIFSLTSLHSSFNCLTIQSGYSLITINSLSMRLSLRTSWI